MSTNKYKNTKTKHADEGQKVVRGLLEMREREAETHVHLAVAARQVEQHTHSQLSERLQLIPWKLLES